MIHPQEYTATPEKIISTEFVNVFSVFASRAVGSNFSAPAESFSGWTIYSTTEMTPISIYAYYPT